MLVTRRQFIEGGAAAGAVAAFGVSPAFAGALDEAAYPPTRSAPRVMVDPVVDTRLLARARASFERHRSRLRNVDMVGIADFSKPSALPRFYLLDTYTGRVSSHLVAHGRGSDPDHSGWLRRFSNSMGSNASSNGAYVTGDFYYGRYGRSMRLSGLDYSNSNAHARAIVVHSAWYAEPNQIAQHGRLGRSEGCFAMSYNSLQETLARLGPGRFLYADKIEA
ncbi:MAG TPA: murein L,D-transpeptidase catalytic domain family protein, partial [Allosphingosinicella sp.]